PNHPCRRAGKWRSGTLDVPFITFRRRLHANLSPHEKVIWLRTAPRNPTKKDGTPQNVSSFFYARFFQKVVISPSISTAPAPEVKDGKINVRRRFHFYLTSFGASSGTTDLRPPSTAPRKIKTWRESTLALRNPVPTLTGVPLQKMGITTLPTQEPLD
ncbi:MAG: hypothetical protein Q4C96_07755, partial [Planctomycetia bacterium]|nr:hypothetical protein [Planctomycetia bacterium]